MFLKSLPSSHSPIPKIAAGEWDTGLPVLPGCISITYLCPKLLRGPCNPPLPPNIEKQRVTTQSFGHRHSLFNYRVTQEITVKLNLNLSATSANNIFPPLLSNAYSAVDMIFNLTPRIDNLVDKIITRVFSCRFGCC